MALQATFVADFSNFQDAVAKAEVSLKSFETGASKVESSLSRMTTSLSGTKLIQDAALMAEAVERVGGVSKLTESELSRIGRTATEAAEKLKAMGQDVPAGIQRLADSTAKAGSSAHEMSAGFDLSWASVTRFAGALGIGFGISQVVSFGKAILDSASHIADLSSKLGTSAEFIQRMSFAATQTGSTIDSVSAAVATMNATLSKGEDSTIAALQRAGLSFAGIRSMRPEEAFLTIASAIKEIKDPMLQAELAVRLFGKSGQELLPAIKQGIKEIGESATVMSDDTVKKLDAAGDAWDRFKGRITSIGGTIFAPVVEALDRILDMGERFMHLDVAGVTLSFLGLKEELDDVKKSGDDVFGALSRSIELLPPPIFRVQTGLRDAMTVLAEFDAQNRTSEEQIRRNISTFDTYNASVKSLVDQWTGAKLAERVKMYAEALELAGGASKLTAYETAGLAKQLAEFAKQGAVLEPVLSNVVLSQTNFNAAIDVTGASLRRVLESTNVYKDTLIKVPPVLTDVVIRSEAVAQATDQITQSTTRAASAALSWSEAMDLVRQGLGTMTGTVPANTDFSEENRQHIDQAYQAGRYFGPVKNGAPDYEALGFPPPSSWGARANGGPVDAGMPYMVGERGPELFVPRGNGTIVPNGGGARILINQTINVQGSVLGSKEELGRAAADALGQQMRDLGYGL